MIFKTSYAISRNILPYHWLNEFSTFGSAAVSYLYFVMKASQPVYSPIRKWQILQFNTCLFHLFQFRGIAIRLNTHSLSPNLEAG